MAARTTRTVGYNCIFEKKPPDDTPTECPVCLLVLREPFQVTCCGKVFCKGCIKEVLQNKRVCPTCKKEEPKCFRDKRVKQTLHGYRVTCGERCGRSVCDWVGQLGQLDNHLNLDPPPEKQLKGCRFAEIKCKFCHKLFLRQQLNTHQQRDCPKRPFKCKYCGHKDTHERGITDHVPMCPKHPMPCPNCQQPYERQTLEHHINEKCPLTPVPCDYHVVGCEVKLARQDMQDHIKKEMMTHVSLLQQHLKQHPQQSGDCLPLVASCLEQLMVSLQGLQEKHVVELENVELKWNRSAAATERRYKKEMEGLELRLKRKIDNLEQTNEDEMQRIEWLSMIRNDDSRLFFGRKITLCEEQIENINKRILKMSGIGLVLFIIMLIMVLCI